MLIIVDTLSRVIGNGDENKTVDMNKLVKSCDVLRAATGAHLMLIYHCGKDKSKGARGSSALRAATDTEIEMTPKRVEATKQRDLEMSWAADVKLMSVILGTDADGDPIKSAVLKLTPAVKADKGESVAKMVKDALRTVFKHGASKEDLIIIFRWRKTGQARPISAEHCRAWSNRS